MEALLSKRLVLVTGKGGVGKSSCGLALAASASKRGKRVLFCDLAARPATPVLLDSAAINDTPSRPLARAYPSLWAVHLSAESAARDYFTESLPHRKLVDIATGNKVLARLWKAAPSFNEFVLLNAVVHLSQGTHPRVKERFDLVVVDLPASGHAVTMLGVPLGITRIAKFGMIASRGKELSQVLADTRHTALCIVTLPEELPVNESIQLVGRLKDEVGLASSHVVINNIVPERIKPNDTTLLDRLLLDLEEGDAKNLVRLGTTSARIQARQAGRIGELKAALGAKFIEVGAFNDEGAALISSIAGALEGAR